MGMYDWFVSKSQAFVPKCENCGTRMQALQTKSFHDELDTYVLRANGTLQRRMPSLVKRFTPMDGGAHVYLGCKECWAWNEWVLTFEGGVLVDLERYEK
jgi:hypothetical protein